ncbi:MAG: epoxyqueuosine reductase QueH [Candidatus Gastranaerophilaceae bacterium]|jgi:hypothetical protein
MQKNKILAHACCAPCASFSLQKLLSDDYLPILYFYNPNIHPYDEYVIRHDELIKFAKSQKIELIIEEPDFDNWFKAVKGLENEPEKGKRCSVCFDFRLNKTAEKALELGINTFTTVLTISPHKNASVINAIGEDIASNAGLSFLKENFKKNDGFKKSIELSKKYGFYRQSYCGCVFSKKI